MSGPFAALQPTDPCLRDPIYSLGASARRLCSRVCSWLKAESKFNLTRHYDLDTVRRRPPAARLRSAVRCGALVRASAAAARSTMCAAVCSYTAVCDCARALVPAYMCLVALAFLRGRVRACVCMYVLVAGHV